MSVGRTSGLCMFKQSFHAVRHGVTEVIGSRGYMRRLQYDGNDEAIVFCNSDHLLKSRHGQAQEEVMESGTVILSKSIAAGRAPEPGRAAGTRYRQQRQTTTLRAGTAEPPLSIPCGTEEHANSGSWACLSTPTARQTIRSTDRPSGEERSRSRQIVMHSQPARTRAPATRPRSVISQLIAVMIITMSTDCGNGHGPRPIYC